MTYNKEACLRHIAKVTGGILKGNIDVSSQGGGYAIYYSLRAPLGVVMRIWAVCQNVPQYGRGGFCILETPASPYLGRDRAPPSTLTRLHRKISSGIKVLSTGEIVGSLRLTFTKGLD